MIFFRTKKERKKFLIETTLMSITLHENFKKIYNQTLTELIIKTTTKFRKIKNK